MDAPGELLSSPAFDATGWVRVELPNTALGALIDAGEWSRVAERIGPEADARGREPEAAFAGPWWFRREFHCAPAAGEHVSLVFEGLNYRARVWLNGEVLAEPAEVVGTHRCFELNIGDRLAPDGRNALAVELFAPGATDLAHDWEIGSPRPLDGNVGIWADVALMRGGPVTLRAPAVLTSLEPGGSAKLRVLAELANHSDRAVEALVHGEFRGHRFSKTVALAAGGEGRVVLTAADAPCLHVQQPELWWPRPLGAPTLHTMALEVEVEGSTSDAERFEFGIRTVEGVRTPEGHAALEVNGERVLVRGAVWTPDPQLRRDLDRERALLDYLLDLNLDTLRFEGLPPRADLLARCDREGVMVIASCSSGDRRKPWAEWSEAERAGARAALRDQVRRTRRHPCMVAWWTGSDEPPPAELERAYLAVLEEEAWPNAAHSSASGLSAEVTGASGLRGAVELGADAAPEGWFEAAEGFVTRASAGPVVPPVESLRAAVPGDQLWPIAAPWRRLAGAGGSGEVDALRAAIEARLGPSDTVEAFAQAAQIHGYEGQRALFEAFTRNRGRAGKPATGVLHRCLGAAWPSIDAHLVDHALRPGGAYFGAKKACEPVHVFYAPDERGVWVSNAHRDALYGARVSVRVFDRSSKLIHARRDRVDVPGGGLAQVTVLPESSEALAFVDLQLSTPAGEQLSHNFYALGEGAALRPEALPPAELDVQVEVEGERWQVQLENTGDAVALHVQLRLCDAEGRDITPAHYSDNYLGVLPGESTRVQVALPGGAPIPADARLEIGALNLAAREHWPDRPERGRGEAGSASAGSEAVDAEVLLLGATGDLAYRKLFRALYQLLRAGDLARGSGLHGLALGPMTRAEFNEHVARSITETLAPNERDPLTTAAFVGAWNYDDLGAEGAWARVAERLRGSTKPRLIYLATSSAHYGSLCDQLAEAGLITEDTRLVIEKPIGHDAASAAAINDSVARHFDERQVFRIDHYLGKETVQNLLALRFANVMFEPLWRNTVVEEVQITVAEDMGVEGRMDFYDRTGALRDMVQAHLLQLVCLVAMEVPFSLTAQAVRDEKLKVMSALRPIRGADVDRCTVRAQYEGYGGAPESETETYVAIRAEVANWRWAGVPFYLRTGKCLSRRRSRISLKFREVPQSIFPNEAPLRANQLDLLLQPDDGIRLKLMAKQAGHGMTLQGADLSLDFHEHDARRRPYSYERLLRDALRGDSTLFVDRREVELGWEWVDPIAAHWKRRGRSGLLRYVPGSTGPTGADRLFESRGGWDNDLLTQENP
ncbi:glucose-6-phosphate dehydrogenase [Plesiocystis pacifica]|uniref:glucose-6-phosphate dehydrogenase n=1 Tax=Plesiocystis pacifica TaxID=191768 RepID=UPI0002DAD571|nr:glucose-6-phosphate dehydrogenase [Plesiocystis pacifica]